MNPVFSGKHTFVMGTKIDGRDAVQHKTLVTVIMDGVTPEQVRELAMKQLRVDIAQPWRKAEKVPATFEVVLADHCSGKRSNTLTAAQIDATVAARASTDAAYRDAKIAELIAMRDASIAREKADAEAKAKADADKKSGE